MNIIKLKEGDTLPELPVGSELVLSRKDGKVTGVSLVGPTGELVAHIEKDGTYSEHIGVFVKDSRTKEGFKIVTGIDGLNVGDQVYETRITAEVERDKLAAVCGSSVESLQLTVEVVDIPLFDEPDTGDEIPF